MGGEVEQNYYLAMINNVTSATTVVNKFIVAREFVTLSEYEVLMYEQASRFLESYYKLQRQILDDLMKQKEGNNDTNTN